MFQCFAWVYINTNFITVLYNSVLIFHPVTQPKAEMSSDPRTVSQTQ